MYSHISHFDVCSCARKSHALTHPHTTLAQSHSVCRCIRSAVVGWRTTTRRALLLFYSKTPPHDDDYDVYYSNFNSGRMPKNDTNVTTTTSGLRVRAYLINGEISEPRSSCDRTMAHTVGTSYFLQMYASSSLGCGGNVRCVSMRLSL